MAVQSNCRSNHTKEYIFTFRAESHISALSNVKVVLGNYFDHCKIILFIEMV